MNKYTKGLKQIGKGAFSKVYDARDGNVIILTDDPTKEAYTLFDLGDRFPKVERLEYDSPAVYRMKKYETKGGIKSKVSAREWKLVKLLQKALDSILGRDMDYGTLYTAIESTFSECPEYDDEQEQLLHALDVMSNCGYDVCMEVPNRNLVVENGKIIFLDIFYMRSKLKEVRLQHARSYGFCNVA